MLKFSPKLNTNRSSNKGNKKYTNPQEWKSNHKENKKYISQLGWNKEMMYTSHQESKGKPQKCEIIILLSP